MTKGILLAVALNIAAVGAAQAAPRFYPRTDATPFSEAVQAGPLLYLSGQVGSAGDGKLVPGGIEPEAHRAMDGIGETLRKHGLDFDSVVKCTVMLADMKDWPTFNTIYATYFKPGHYPARSAIGANGLALGARVEVECIAWVGESPNKGRAR